MSDYKKPFMDLNNLVPDVYRNPVLQGLISNLFNRFLTKKEATPVYGMIGNLDTTTKVTYERLDKNIELDIYVSILDSTKIVDGEELVLTVFDVDNQILEVSTTVGSEQSQIVLGQKQKVQNKFIVAPRLVSSKLAPSLKVGKQYTIRFSVTRTSANIPFIGEMNLDREQNQLVPFNITTLNSGEKALYSFNDVMNRLRTLGVSADRYIEWGRQQAFNFNLPIDYDKFTNFSRYYWYGHLDLVFDYLVVDRPQQGVSYSFGGSKFGLASGTTLKTPVLKRVTGLTPVRTDLSLVGLNSVNTTSVTIDVQVLQFQAEHVNREMNFFVVQMPSGEHVLQYTHAGSNETFTFAVSGQNYIVDNLSVTATFLAERLIVGEQFKVTIKPDVTEMTTSDFFFTSDGIVFTNGQMVNNCYVVQFIGKPFDNIKSYNPDYLPQYYTIQRAVNGVTNDWQRDNFWIHEDDVAKFNDNNLPGHPSFFNSVYISQLKQAKRPIIEFNATVKLNEYVTSDGKFVDDQFDYGALIGAVGTPYVQLKGDFNQAPKFDLYYHTGVHTGEAKPLLSYEQGNTYDPELKLYVSRNHWDQLNFNCALFTTEQKLYCYYETGLLKTAWDGSSAGYPVYVYKDETGKLITLSYKDIAGSSWQFADVKYISPLVASFLSLTQTYPVNAEVYAEAEGEVNGWSPANVSQIIIDINAVPAGAWVYPQNKFLNPFFENKKIIPYNELFSHFNGIINENEKNNASEFFNPYRFITGKDLGMGGTIKNFDKNFELFSAIHYLSNVSVPAVIDFAKHQYQLLLNEADVFARNSIVEFLTSGHVSIDLDGQKYGQGYILRDDFTQDEPGQAQFATDLEDFLSTRGLNVFSDTTAGVKNWIMTLPYIGLTALVKPEISTSSLIGFPPSDASVVLKHHDGHISLPISLAASEVVGMITAEFSYTDEFGRLIKVNSAPRETDPEGTLLFNNAVGTSRPVAPFNGQFWFNTNNDTLWFFNAGKLTSAAPRAAELGEYWYNYSSENMLQWDGNQWQPSSAELEHFWIPVDLSYFSNKFRYKIEERLYEGCHYDQSKLKTEMFQYDKPTLNSALEPEFIKYALRESIPTYEPTYFNPQNAFTWNYSRVKFPYVDAMTGSWTEIYLQHLGTSRPDLEPWKLFDLESKSDYVSPIDPLRTWDDDYKDYSGARPWLPQVWLDILSYLPTSPRPDRKLCVNPNTGELLPPYVSNMNLVSQHALTTVIPTAIDALYKFSDGYAPEMLWRQSIDYGYDFIKALYNLDPLNFITASWGLNYTERVNEYAFHRKYGKTANNGEMLLHGEMFNADLNNLIIKVEDRFIPTLTLTVVHVQNDIVKFAITDGTNSAFFDFNTNYRFDTFDFFGATLTFIERAPQEYNIGDSLTITNNATITRVNYPIYRTSGLNQWFVNFCRFNSISLTDSDIVKVLKSTDMQLGYRVGGYVADGSLTLVTNSQLTADDYSTVIKQSLGTRDAWFDALRVQVVGIGTKSIQDENNPSLFYPTEKADDWTFRIEMLNPAHPTLKFYYPNTDEIETFQAFSGAHCKVHWTKPYSRATLIQTTAPLVVKGMQNLINVIFGYANYLDQQGWRFAKGADAATDPDSGRVISWQFQMERFIDNLYQGSFVPNGINPNGATSAVSPGGAAVILNPAPVKLWYQTPIGSIAKFDVVTDPYLSQAVFDVGGGIIDHKQLLILRDADWTEIKSMTMNGGAHVMIDEFEHVVLLSDFLIGPNEIMFNKFAGVHRSNILFSGEKTKNYSGRLSTPGYYLTGHALKENFDSSVSGFKNFYDSSKYIIGNPVTTEAKKLLGYNNPAFFQDVTVSEKTKFEFWKGLLFNKGTNQSINAFFNSSLFKEMRTDEFWAFKMAEYGQDSPREYPEMKIKLSDVNTYLTKYSFTEVERPGYTHVAPTDETRWMSYQDLTTNFYFESATLCAEFVEGKPGDIIQLSLGTDEVIVSQLTRTDDQRTTPDEELLITTPAFILKDFQKDMFPGVEDLLRTPLVEGTDYIKLNAHAIKLLPHITTGVPTGEAYKIIEVKCVGLPFQYFDPIKLIDYKNNQLVDDVQIWDPARGIYNTTFLGDVSIIWPEDPATYNQSTSTTANPNYNAHHAWADEHVGKIWWDNKNLGYKHYFDPILIPNVDSRLAIWGDLADHASVDVYQWVKSPVAPEGYVDYVTSNQDAGLSGEPALQKTFFKVRDWKSRPIAWATTTTDAMPSFGDAETSNISLYISTDQLVLSTGSWENFDLTPGKTKISGGLFCLDPANLVVNNKNRLDSDIVKPFGEADITGAPYKVIGSSYDPNNVYFVPMDCYGNVKVGVNVDAKDDALGEYVITTRTDAGITYVSLVNTATGNTEELPITFPGGLDESIDQAIGINLSFTDVMLTLGAKYVPITTSGTEYDAANTSIAVEGVTILAANDVLNNGRGTAFSKDNGTLYVRSNGTWIYHLERSVNPVDDAFAWVIVGPAGTFTLTPATQFAAGFVEAASSNVDSVNSLDLATLATKIGLGLSDINNQVYVRSAIPAKINIDFKFIDKIGNIINVMERATPVIDAKVIGATNATYVDPSILPPDPNAGVPLNISDWFEGWFMYDEPDKADVEIDRLSPNNEFCPVLGDFLLVTESYYSLGGQPVQHLSKDHLTFIKEAQEFALVTGTTIKKVQDTWSSWQQLQDKTFSYFVTDATKTFDFSKELLFTENVRVFTNGFETTQFSLSDGVLTLTPKTTRESLTDVCLGDEVVVKYFAYKPSATQLQDGENVAVTEQVAYKSTVDYTVTKTLDETGQVDSTTYYFWVKNVNLSYQGKQPTINIKDGLINTNKLPYACFPVIDADETYRVISFYNLKSEVSVDEQYKLQFIRDFAFRDTSTDQKQKNIHEEWIIQQASQPTAINAQLWSKLVDSACGETRNGTVLPAPALATFDMTHGTWYRYGFADDQVLADPIDIFNIIVDIFTEYAAEKNFDNYKFTADASTNYGYDDIRGYLNGSAAIRFILNKLYLDANPALINRIFFTTLEHSLSENRHLRDVFKTSYIAVVTNKIIGR